MDQTLRVDLIMILSTICQEEPFRVVYQKTDQLVENQDGMLTSSNRSKNRTLLSNLRTERRPHIALKLQSRKYKTATAIDRSTSNSRAALSNPVQGIRAASR
jgi:hypothetical protein